MSEPLDSDTRSVADGASGGSTTAVAPQPSVVAVFGDHSTAERAVNFLARTGFDMRRLSIIGKDYRTEERPVGFYNIGDRIRVWGSRGAFWGALMGLLVSPAFFLLPIVGHIIVLGPLTSAIVGTLEGAVLVGGASALAGALASIGIPRDSVMRYETAIKADKFVLIVHDTRLDAHVAEEVLRKEGAESVESYEGEPSA